MSIASRIETMEQHIEQAYDELQGLGADLTNVNKNIENISMVLDDIYDSMPQVSGEGTSLTLDDTRVGKIKSTLKGNTSQTGTPTPSSPIPVNVVSGDNKINVCGKNLFDKNNYVDNYYISADGSLIYQSGDFTSEFISVSTGKYIASIATNAGNLIRCAVYDKNKNFIRRELVNGGLTLPITISDNERFVRISAYKSSLNSMQLEKGETTSTYEPYQGNTYNIDLGGLGKNKFDINSITKGIELNSNTGKTQENSSWWTSAFIPIKSNQAYTSSNISSNSKCWYDENKNFISYIQSQTATSPANAKYLRVNGTLASLESNPQAQIEEGNSVTTFEAYNSIELCKIGNYQDYFYKDSGKWYLHKEIGKVVFNGSETWYKSASYPGNYYCQNGVPNATFHDINCFSNLTNVFWYSIEQLASGDNGIMLEGGSANRTIDFKISSISTLADFKTFLGNTNLILYYTLLTPTNTEITYQPLIDQLNLLEKAMSKDGQTNISQVNNDLPFIISASALKEWQENTSLNSTLSMVNPLSLGNTLNTQEIDNNTQPIEVDNIEPLEEEESEES